MAGYNSPGTPDTAAFFAQVLADLGAPASSANINFFLAWAPWEGTAAANNPLASEQNRVPGSVASTGIPGAPAVQNYRTPSLGAAETAAELEAIAPNIVQLLRADNIAAAQDNQSVIAEVSHWGTQGFARALGGHGGAPVSQTESGTPPSVTPSRTGTASTPWGTLAWQGTDCESLSASMSGGSGVLGFVSGTAKYLGQGCIRARVFLFVGGAAAVLVGLKVIGRPEPLRIVTGAPAAVARGARNVAEAA